MRQLFAMCRLGGAVVVLLIGTPLVLIGALLSLKIQNDPAPAYFAVRMARLCCLLFNIRLEIHEKHRIANHIGLIFPNHLSYLDSIILLASGPVRFLSTAEVKRYPLIGWIARSLGTVFVERGDRNSRQQARSAVTEAFRAQPSPPIVIYPEGRLGIGTALFAFRHGAFEIVAKNGISYLPCAVQYDPADIAIWRGVEGETLLPAVWRLATYSGPVIAKLIPLTVVTPSDDEDPALLAAAAQAEIAQALAIETIITAEMEEGVGESMPAPAWQKSVLT